MKNKICKITIRPELLEGVAGKEVVTFSGGCNFYIKNSLKSEIFNEKLKFINKNIFLYCNLEFKLGNFN